MRTLACLGVLAALAVVPATAQARPGHHDDSKRAPAGDRNRDRLPDRWERHHRLSLRVKQTYRDQDRDGLNNLGEYRSRTNPRDRDTDDDGLRDGRERKTGHDPRDPDTDDDGVRDGNEHAGAVASYEAGTGRLTLTLAGGGSLTGLVTRDTRIKCESQHENGLRLRTEGSDEEGAEPECGPHLLVAGAPVHEAWLRLSGDGLIFDKVVLAG